MSREQRERVKEIGRWLADSDAGQALWHIHFGNFELAYPCVFFFPSDPNPELPLC